MEPGQLAGEGASRARTEGRGRPRRPTRSEGLQRTPAAIRDERNCSVARTLDIVSDAWAFLIIREAFFETRTFEGFQASLDIPRATLADRLRKLTEWGVFRKAAPSSTARRQEYRLTKAGYDLYPSFIALMQFGDRWLSAGGKPPLTLVHMDCGCECRPIVACSECRSEVTAGTVSYRDGSGAGRTPMKPGRVTRRSTEGKFSRGRPSSVSRALEIIGDKWSFMVLREAFFGVRRYDRMQASLGIAPNILTDRLSRFVAKGILERRPYQSSPPRYEYRLTEMGRDLYGALIVMLAWADRWLAKGAPPLVLTHHACGKDFQATVLCDRCLRPIHAAAMRYRLSYDPERYGAAGPRQYEPEGS